MRRLRAFYWQRLRCYHGEICGGHVVSRRVARTHGIDRAQSVIRRGCGRPVRVVWAAPSDLWNLVVGGPGTLDDPGGILCIPCFTAALERTGLKPYPLWTPVPIDTDLDRLALALAFALIRGEAERG